MDYTALAKEIVIYYPIRSPDIEFIRHNENITFKITYQLNSNCYLLRIHMQVTEGFAGIQNTLEGLQSEMIFLNELCPSAGCKSHW